MESVIMSSAAPGLDIVAGIKVWGYAVSHLIGDFEKADFKFWCLVVLCVLAITLVPYILGSINFGIIVSRIRHGEDIRSFGSGNAGTTNILRTYGKADAAVTFVGDLLKSVIAVMIGRFIFGFTGGYIAAFWCIVGHAFPCFYRFKGGKGVAVCAAAIAVIDIRIFFILLAIFVIIVALTKYISLGSVSAMFFLPILEDRMNLGLSINPLLAIMIAALVIFLHRSNIVRIYKGTESKVSFSKTDKHKKDE